MAGYILQAERSMEGLVLLPPGLFQCRILLEEGEGLGVSLVGVKVKPQLQKNELQGLELSQRAADRVGSVLLQKKGQVQPGKESAVAESVSLAIALGIGLLEGNIRHRQGRALRQRAAAVGTASRFGDGGLIGIGIQCLFLLVIDGRGENSSGSSYVFLRRWEIGEIGRRMAYLPVLHHKLAEEGMYMKKAGKKKFLALAAAMALALTGTCRLLRTGWPAAPAFVPVRMPERQLILDAGHGGEDGGAVSLTGEPESNINLAVVLRTDQLLGLYGVSPLLIRDSDISIYDPGCETLRQKKVSDLHNRVSIIEETENAVVISVHQNTFTNPAYHGAQVFFREGNDSKALAELMQSALREGIDAGNKRTPTKIPDSVYLMKHITCPAVLVECGFLSHPAEEKKLRSGSYQTQLALCIASAWLRSGEIGTGNGTEDVVQS